MVTTQFYDGQKNIDISTMTADRWHELFGIKTIGGPGVASAADAWSTQGWVNRCVSVRANTVAAMPWSIMRGDNEIARSDDHEQLQAELPWLKGLGNFLYLVESSLCLTSEAYIHKRRNVGKRLLGLQWLAASTMTAEWADQRAEIEYFVRKYDDGTQTRLPTNDVIYAYLPSPIDETGPAPSPVEVALLEAGVLVNINAFTQQFFQRGAIKAMLLQVEGVASQAELDKLQAWWQRWFAGVRSAWQSVAVRAGVTPVVVGEGIESLSNKALTDEKREAISTAMGVPHSIVMSNAANFATADADRLSFYDFTILPECRLIESAFNDRLFADLGLRFTFRPESLPVYQDDEREASETIRNLAQAGVRPSHAMLILGRQLPEGVTAEQFDEAFMIKANAPKQLLGSAQAAQDGPAGNLVDEDDDEDDDEERAAEAKAFRNWLKNNLNRLDRLSDFQAQHLTEADKRAIAYDLAAKRGHGHHHHHQPIKGLRLDNPEIDPVLAQYEADLQALVQQAVDEEIDRRTFADNLRDLAVAALLLAFLRGTGRSSVDDLDLEQTAELERVMRNVDQGVGNLADDIFTGRYGDERGIERAIARTGLWVTTLAGAYHTAVTLQREGDKRYVWLIGATQESCTDCLRLHGQVHTAAQWRAAGWAPQSSRLECGGWNCDCKLELTESETEGGF